MLIIVSGSSSFISLVAWFFTAVVDGCATTAAAME